MTEPLAHILIVDDDPITLQAMEALLGGPGRAIHPAKSGREALRYLLDQDAALILLDVRMPDMDGLETAALIRQRERFRYTPIIFLSGVDILASDVDKGLTVGAIDYLFKPVIPTVLRTKVAAFVDLYHEQQRLRQQALEQNEHAVARLAAIVGFSHDAIISKTLDGVITTWNRGAQEIFGYTVTEAVGQHISLIIPPEGRAAEDDVLARLRRGDKIDPFETERLAKDGRRLQISLSISPINDAKGQIIGVSTIARDITLQKRTEEELFRASKMESLGVVAGGIAHDFNNILTAIIGNLTLIKMRTGPESPDLLRITDSEKEVLRARSLTQQLLTFAKGGEPLKQVLSLRQLLTESASFVLQGSNSTCEVDMPDDLWFVDADAGQISQVIHNLVLNADQAMSEGGTIRIQAMNAVIGPDDRLPLPSGPYICIRVTDHGSGIAPKDLRRIFDPFFTTKPNGTGLGLTTAYSIIKRHHGHLDIASTPGQGTMISFYLPRSTERPVAEAAPQAPIARGACRILFMDDEASLRKITRALLPQLGYQVECVKDGAEAIEQFRKAREEGHPFNVVILDLTVPMGMGGKEAMRRLRELDPQVKAIVSSGYSADPVMSNFKAYGFSGVITKPYAVETLSHLLDRLCLS